MTTQPADFTDESLLEDDVEYFNLEISPEGTTLVFNASKSGIDTFLRSYGHLEIPPKVISFRELNRPARQWYSWDIEVNQDISAKDLTPYRVSNIGGYYKNHLINDLHIQFLDQEQEKPILAAGLEENAIKLIMNKKGWQDFLTLVRHLRDKSYWFYVTPPNPYSLQNLPFVLTLPYPGGASGHIFKAIEFIRLEPVEEIFFDISSYATLAANSSGWLLFSRWMHNFAKSNEISKDICNYWQELPKNMNACSTDQRTPAWIHARKIQIDAPYPIFSFETNDKDEKTSNYYIFGNAKGFAELAGLAEQYAFYSDHDCNGSMQPDHRWRGAPAVGVFGPEGFRSIGSWELQGGGLFTPKYNPLRFIGSPANPSIFDSEQEIKRNFLNERMLLKDEID